jgi:UPF0716 family protein affecting phage T7 exclusion
MAKGFALAAMIIGIISIIFLIVYFSVVWAYLMKFSSLYTQQSQQHYQLQHISPTSKKSNNYYVYIAIALIE